MLMICSFKVIGKSLVYFTKQYISYTLGLNLFETTPCFLNKKIWSETSLLFFSGLPGIYETLYPVLQNILVIFVVLRFLYLKEIYLLCELRLNT